MLSFIRGSARRALWKATPLADKQPKKNPSSFSPFSLPRNYAVDGGVPFLSMRPQMEAAMCYSRGYKLFDDQQKKAQDQANQDRRTGVIDKLLDDANKQGDETKEATPVKDVVPAK
jgi:hypothetical protein